MKDETGRMDREPCQEICVPLRRNMCGQMEQSPKLKGVGLRESKGASGERS